MHTVVTVPEWDLECYTFAQHSGASVWGNSGTPCPVPASARFMAGTPGPSASQCLDHGRHSSAQCPGYTRHSSVSDVQCRRGIESV